MTNHTMTRHIQLLSPRQREIASLIKRNAMSDKEVANELAISPYTVRFHLKSIFRKLGIHSRLELVTHPYSFE